MAHIADFMVDTKRTVGLNNHIARELSPHSLQDAATETPTDEKEKYVWRMHQPTESRKYQLFPAKEKLSITAGRKSPDPETVFSVAMGQTGASEKAASLLGQALRIKPKEQTLVRRRKVSVPELGPMTTVQEIAMDSPTIPGRPPLHERSISAPGNSWRQHVFGESMLSCISGPALDENAEMAESITPTGQANNDDSQNTLKQLGNSSSKQALSPKVLAPLVIPSTSAPQPRLARQSSTTRLRAGSTPPDVPPKSARMLDSSPYPRASPYTPHSASTLSLLSTAPTSVSSTPLSAHPTSVNPTSATEGRSSPKPALMSAGPTPSTMGHARGQSEQTTSRSGHTMGHRRHESEGGSSIMDRGRPKKRPDGSPMKRRPSIRTAPTSDEQKAFETLPQGIRATQASTLLPANEIESLRKQAIGQASRFEVLASKDVDALSRELRGLDERCEYLRKTHRSLRSGRRNLHDRICTYLRSPRVARFSHESILKQEEALSELDSSIDDWVSKLEQAENRRTRVRQKLLEHVAGALIMQPQVSSPNSAEESRERSADGVSRKSTVEMNTPPRSPTKSQSPQRLAEQVEVSSPESMGRRDVESIRIYADSDISALLKDVEEEISRIETERKNSATPTLGTPKIGTPVMERSREREGSSGGRVDERGAVVAGVMLNAVAFQPQSRQPSPYGRPEFV